MMNYTQAAVSIAFLTIIMTSGICSSSLNDKQKSLNKKKSEQESILEAFENNDYKAWRAIVKKNSDLINVVKEKEFARFIQARDYARQGLYDRSIAISSSLERELRSKIAQPLLLA